MSEDSLTSKDEFSFPDLKLWVQIRELKNMTSVSGLKKWGRDLKKIFKKKSKKFQNAQTAQNRSQNYPNVFWTCFGVIFLKKFFAQCSMEGRVFKIKNFSKFQKGPKSFPKMSKRVLNMFWGNFFEKNFLPSVPWRVESSKSKIFQNSKKAQNLSQKCPNVFWTCFGVIFSKKKFCPVFHGGSNLQLLLIWLPNNADSICKKVSKKLKLRRPGLHTIILHCGTKSAKIAPPNTLMDSYDRFLPEAQPYLNSMTRTPISKPYITTLPEKNLS